MASQLPDFQFTEDHLDSNLGFTFGCHSINTMVGNIYEDCKDLMSKVRSCEERSDELGIRQLRP